MYSLCKEWRDKQKMRISSKKKILKNSRYSSDLVKAVKYYSNKTLG